MGVTKRVVEDGLRLNLEKKEGEKVEVEDESGPSITWVNMPELKFGGGESVSVWASFEWDPLDSKKHFDPQLLLLLLRLSLTSAFFSPHLCFPGRDAIQIHGRRSIG